VSSPLLIEKCPAEQARTQLAQGTVALRWLGQAGFFFHWNGLDLMIDPYLTDSLARKYKGTEFPHLRSMAVPIQPQEVRNLDWVLCTHRHSDHMDPDTLAALAQANPDCRCVVPRAVREQALAIGLLPARTFFVNAGEELRLAENVSLKVMASAHEQLKVNSQGEHYYLGYILSFEGISFYHSGDCIPNAHLAEDLHAEKIDVALLPINGRNAHLSSRGILGNFSFDEAVALCRAAQIQFLISHHWGMFEFNTIDPDAVRSQIANQARGVTCHLPAVAEALLFARSSNVV
jgi:L-ascorbate metabolism protein UlaG (beta-lactamase superfamily)